VRERRVVITGASGLLGAWLRRTTPDDTRVTALTHRTSLADDGVATITADLRDADATLAAVIAAEPSVVIHAAYALDEASIVDATANVVAATTAVGAELVFTSTDAVFSGDGRWRAEGDQPDPVADYGRWKVTAEQCVARCASPTATVRLPLLASIDPDDHVVGRIRAEVGAGTPMTWFDDELRQPARADEVALALWRIVALPADERAGTWHLPGPDLLSRHAIAVRVATALGLDPGLIRPEPSHPDANRPRDLRLSDDRARQVIGWEPTAPYSNLR
jgi:dTDP-4-dehydrorhamnose reductase